MNTAPTRRGRKKEFEPLRFMQMTEQDLLTEEDVRSRSHSPFLGPGDRPEPYRSYYVAYARFTPLFERLGKYSQLLVDVPGKGRGLLYRVGRTWLEVLLINGNILEKVATRLSCEEYSFFQDQGDGRPVVTFVWDTVVLNPPVIKTLKRYGEEEETEEAEA